MAPSPHYNDMLAHQHKAFKELQERVRRLEKLVEYLQAQNEKATSDQGGSLWATVWGDGRLATSQKQPPHESRHHAGL